MGRWSARIGLTGVDRLDSNCAVQGREDCTGFDYCGYGDCYFECFSVCFVAIIGYYGVTVGLRGCDGKYSC